jgi:hypothetical protein
MNVDQTAAEYADDWAIDTIEYYANALIFPAQRIDVAATELERRRPFRTRMESSLDKAEESLNAALLSVRAAKKAYLEKAAA